MFFFAPCQVGAEATLKAEISRLFPDCRSSFARPGFLTFKGPDDHDEAEELIVDWAEQSVFSRTVALSLGQIKSEDLTEVAVEAWKIAEENRRFINRIHVFARDTATPGHRDFEPGATPKTLELHRKVFESAPRPKFFGVNAADPLHPALLGETILDLVEIDPGLFFVGVHNVFEEAPIQAFYPGGVMPITIPENAVSRAWLKFEEGLRWSGLPIEKGTCCLDIGASPGGGSQVLLSRGAKVLGVDPAEIDPRVLENPNFTHIRSRVNQARRSLFKDVRWLIADMNVAPAYTLNVLEDFAASKDTKLRGMLFTLKLFEWKLAEELPKYVAQIRRWGFHNVRVRQLAFNRQEVMVAAQK